MQFVTLLVVICTTNAFSQYAPARPEWNRPIEPFRIVANLYYVGASDVSSFLITTPEGHILIDTGFPQTAALVESNVRKSGFRPEDIHILLASHAHYDHAGGVAEIKSRTKARFLANPAESAQFARGGKGDFAFGDAYAFPALKPDGPLHDGAAIALGGVSVTAHFTPGHTKGCTSYTTTVRDGQSTYRVAIVCSVTAPGYRLVNNRQYPEIVEDFRSTFAKLRSLPCDVFLAGHGWEFGLEEKRKLRSGSGGANPFVDPEGYRRWVDKSEAAFLKQVEEQQHSEKARK